jgi:hypothetical protein
MGFHFSEVGSLMKKTAVYQPTKTFSKKRYSVTIISDFKEELGNYFLINFLLF